MLISLWSQYIASSLQLVINHTAFLVVPSYLLIDINWNRKIIWVAILPRRTKSINGRFFLFCRDERVPQFRVTNLVKASLLNAVF